MPLGRRWDALPGEHQEKGQAAAPQTPRPVALEEEPPGAAPPAGPAQDRAPIAQDLPPRGLPSQEEQEPQLTPPRGRDPYMLGGRVEGHTLG